MNINLSISSEISLYEQIISQIKTKIMSSELVCGDLIPSIRNLSSELSVSIITVKRAYEELENQGFIKSVPAKGYYVTSNNIENLKDVATKKIEQQLEKIITSSKIIGLEKSDIIDMIEVLYEN